MSERPLRSLLSAFLLLGLIAPLGGALASDDPALNEVIAERAQSRWDALIAGEWEKAYGLLAPGYRSTTPFPIWRGQFGQATTWKSASIRDILCNEDGDRCQVDLILQYVVSLPQMGIRNQARTRPLRETWLLVDEEWWHFPQR